MNENFKHIHIGKLISRRVAETNIDMLRICNFLGCAEKEISAMYEAPSMDTEILLRWSKLLEYDFFRLYTQHIILYAPPENMNMIDKKESRKTKLPVFRKNIYTREIIDFILKLLETGAKTKSDIISEYRIPKTTLYKWISKNIPENNSEK